MTEYPRRDEPTRRLDGGPYGNPGYSDPAYADQTPYGARPTEQMPAYPAYGYDPYTGQYGTPPPPPGAPGPPEPPRAPRWLWIVAGIAVLTVLGLVIALVIVNSSQQQTVVAPVPSLTEPTAAPAPPSTSRRPTTTTTPRTVAPTPSTTPSTPTTTAPATPGATQTVVYNVIGQGRAINITYVDNGGVLQTEFNVVLPWSKEVALPEPAKQSASVSIINVGREVTCSIDIEGAPVQQRTGSGLTICSPLP